MLARLDLFLAEVCGEEELIHFEDFLSVPLQNTIKDGEKTFTSDGTVRVNYKLERFEPFNLQSLTIKLNNVKAFTVKYFFFGEEDSPSLKVSMLNLNHLEVAHNLWMPFKTRIY